MCSSSETDKPIYKPGQDMHIRVLLLDVELKPVSGGITVEVQDAKGNKVFREVVESDEFGMASLTMPLSTEPNFGKWSIAASFGDQEAQTDVRVERYVLPKYEIDVDFPQEWTAFGEPITGTVSAEYSFGKPVRGELKIVASKYNYEWVEFAEFTAEIDGTASFELPATEYISSGRGPDGNRQRLAGSHHRREGDRARRDDNRSSHGRVLDGQYPADTRRLFLQAVPCRFPYFW